MAYVNYYWWVLPNLITVTGFILFGISWVFLITWLFWMLMGMGLFFIILGATLTGIRRRAYYSALREEAIYHHHQHGDGTTYVVTTGTAPPQNVYAYQPVYSVPQQGYQGAPVASVYVQPGQAYGAPTTMAVNPPPYNPSYNPPKQV